MTITLLDNEGPTLAGFKWFWMKRVTGFNPAHHCARCLTGEIVTRVSNHMLADAPCQWFTPSGGVYYLCGVSAPYVHAKNFHLAMRPAPGSRIEAALYTGARLVIEGMEEIPFDDAAARNRFPRLGEDYLSCRNFQFGAQHFKQEQPSLF